MTASTDSTASETHQLHCMEVWGGNDAIDNGVSVPGIDAWFYSRPYQDDAQGGDVHYASMCAAGRIARFAVADVAGHGSEVAKFAVHLRTLMRKHINTPDQTKITRALNEELLTRESQGRFATALLVTFYAPDHQLIICNAGHPRPLWFRAETGAWAELHYEHEGALEDAGNLPLGVIEPTAYHQFAVSIAPGDLVLIVTDGVTEALNPDGQMLGSKGFLKMAEKISRDNLASFIPALVEALHQYRGAAPANDDLTAVLLHHNDAPARNIGLAERAGAMAKMLGLSRS